MGKNPKQQRGLGRGLSALMSDVDVTTPQASGGAQVAPTENLHPNPDQPRKAFIEDDLQELAASVREKGVIQPLIVRNLAGQPGHFQIVAGERRWRAAQLAQLHRLPIVVKEFSDQEVLEIGIIENIQRKDLNPLEEAQSFRHLMERFGHTQEQVSKALGKSRSYIANLIRLLNLPDDVQGLIEDGKLSAGHARALITSENPSQLAAKVVAGGMSVRDTEKLAKNPMPSDAKPKSSRAKKDADTAALEGDLSAALKMGVSIEHDTGSDGGRISIRYKSLEQLDDLCRILTGG